MSEESVPAPSGARLSSFSKRPLKTAAFILLGLALLLHRPLLNTAIEELLRSMAAKQGLTLNVHVSGNPFRQWTLEQLRLKPAAAPHPNIDFIRIQQARLTYNPFALLFRGPKHCVTSLSADGVRLVWHTSAPSGSKSAAGVISFLSGLMAFPAVAPDSIALTHVDIEVSSEGANLFLLKDGSLTADPEKQGRLSIGLLQCADLPALHGLEAQTTYHRRHFVLQDLRLSPALGVKELHLGPAASGRAYTELTFEVYSGEGILRGGIHSNRRSGPWTASLDAVNFSCAAVREFLKCAPGTLPEKLAGKVQFEGTPTRPHTWKGALNGSWQMPLSKGHPADFRADVSLSRGELTVGSLEIKTPFTELAAKGAIHLPENGFAIQTCSGDLSLEASSSDVAEWLPAGAHSAPRAQATSSAKIHLSRGVAQVDFKADTREIISSAWKAGSLHAEGTLAAPVTPPFALKNMAGNALISIKKPALETPELQFSLEEALSAVSLSENSLRFWNIQLKDANNAITGEVALPISEEATPAEARLEFHLQNIAGASLSVHGQRLSGTLHGSLQGGIAQGLPHGDCHVSGTGLGWGAFTLGEMRLKAESTAGVIQIQELALAWSPQEWIRANGKISTAAPYPYEVDAAAQIPKMERAAPLFKQMGWAKQCSGALEGSLKGKGEIKTLTGTGEWSLILKDARWDGIHLNSLACAGIYRPGQFLAEPLRITTPDTKFAARVEWREDTLRIENIALEQWGTPTLSGYLLLPLTRDETGTHWVKDARLAGQLRAEKLDIANLYTGAGKPADLSGNVQFSLAISGTAEAPSAAFNLRATNLRAKAAPRFGPMEVELKGGYSEVSLSVEGKILSPLNAPILVQAQIPLNLNALVFEPVALGALPVNVHVQTTGASLKPLGELWPGLRRISGTASLDATLKGSFENPKWMAKLRADCPVIHFASDRVPAINDLHATAEFDGKHLHINNLRADLGGGSLDIQGAATFDSPDNPTLNFTAKAREILAVRNQYISLRLNGDLFLRGPWKRAVIGGSAAAVKSRVQRDIEVLPLTSLLPNAAKEQRSAGKPWFTFTRAPFSDWKFDVSLSTTPGDPIVLRGNRLKGTADAELKLEGSGATPTLHGAYRTSDLVASLPFARIEISRGRVWYTRDRPFLPQIDFSAETEVRNHRIRLYLAGPADAPQVSIHSEPPLGETDLLTLLTTGALPADATENSQALASRAATVLFQEFSDKVFKPSFGKERFSALQRFSLDLSALNSRTGHQETRLTYRLTDKFFLISEIGADGDFAGRFRYVLRFR